MHWKGTSEYRFCYLELKLRTVFSFYQEVHHPYVIPALCEHRNRMSC